MKFLIAILLSCAAVWAVGATPPEITAINVVADAGTPGKYTFSTTIKTNGARTNLTFRYGFDGKLDKAIPRTIDDSTTPVDRTETVTQLAGGQNYVLRVEATNSASDVPTQSDFPFQVPAYLPSITGLKAKTSPGGIVMLLATVNANGVQTKVTFEYGLTANPQTFPNPKAADAEVQADGFAHEVDTTITGLDRGAVYHYRVFASGQGVTPPTDGTDFFVATPNQPPQTRADVATLHGSDPIVVDVLKNDRDPEQDKFSLVAVSAGKQGTAEIVDGKIKYTPGPTSNGPEVLTYTVTDDFAAAPKSSTGTLTIRAPGIAAIGTHAVPITDADGNVMGMLRLVGNAGGTVSGKLDFYDQTYRVSGVLDENGRFHAIIPRGENGPLDLKVTFDQSSASTALQAQLMADGQKFKGDAPLGVFSKERRAELVGSYTLQIPAPGGTATDGLPGGAGFMRIEVRDWGAVTFKGKLGDGTKFSGSSVLSGTDAAPTVAYWLTPEDSRLSGDLVFSTDQKSKLTSAVKWYRSPNGDSTFFPDGFYTEVGATGGYYQQPVDGRRALSPEASSENKATLTLSNGDLGTTITRQYDISKGDRLDLLNPTGDDPTLKIDRKKGIFKGEFNLPVDGSNRKFEGVLVQQEQLGRGVFIGVTQTGTVELKLGATTPTPTPTPTPNPGTGNGNGNGNGGINTGGIDTGGIDLGNIDLSGNTINKARKK